MTDSCIFCAIVAGRASARIVHQDDAACSFLDLHPLRTGHTLVVPKSHVRDLAAPGAAEAVAALGPALQATSRLLADKLGADGISVLQANGGAAGQTVFHLHFHLVPRWAGDAPLADWTPEDSGRGTLDDLHRVLTTAEV